MGGEYGLLDVGGKPKNKWAAGILAKGKKAHARERK